MEMRADCIAVMRSGAAPNSETSSPIIAPCILEQYSELSLMQQKVVGHVNGPLLVIAGPGAGKTACIVLRALNLLLLGEAIPRNLVLCTYTEKAAYEMRDRLSTCARKVEYRNDLSELRISTIHGLCNRILQQYRHRTSLGHGYEVLDELTQLLFMFENFDSIIGSERNGLYLGRWRSRWKTIKRTRAYFDKITEELVSPQALVESDDESLVLLGEAYLAYEKALCKSNRVDFAHLQSTVYSLLADPEIGPSISSSIKYLIVDEYQDTNYIQEQLLLRLSENTRNLCVVGDEDQSIFRFRGATVRNILEFKTHFPECSTIELTTNYRSHKDIIKRYDHWMASADWSNPQGLNFRHDKTIEPDLETEHLPYPSVFRIWGQDERDEADRFADLVQFLKGSGVIEDYSQVALLLRSVRKKHSGRYIDALQARGIPTFCPRARGYFESDEVQLMVGCFAFIFGWYGEDRGDAAGAIAELARYVDDCLVQLGSRFGHQHNLAQALRDYVAEISALNPGMSLDLRPADYFYRLLAVDPFVTILKNENAARNLAVFSQLLNVFQAYYHYTVITHRNRDLIRFHFFNSFLRLLYEGGINEYEDPDQPFPRGHVQIMTIHQAKGLEFPVVIVGSLDSQLSTLKQIDRDLGPFCNRRPFEPVERITLFDRMRLHYVAFSRAQKLLVLSAGRQPKNHFAAMWEDLPQWPYVRKDLLSAQRFRLRDRMPIKKSYSFTGDLRIYETCPRQYQFFREYDFTPSRSAVIFFGLLVHQTIEEIHRIALDGKLDTLNRTSIRAIFDRSFNFLCLSDVRPIGDVAKESAFAQVMNYFRQNRDEMRRIVQTEVDVSLEKDDYILVGKVDLLIGGDGKLELLDFKTSPRPDGAPELMETYERQLCTYAHVLEQRLGHRVDRLLLYWTGETKKERALMCLPYRPERIDDAGRHFDEIVRCIQRREFRVARPPGAEICKECDLKRLCAAEGIVSVKE
jgi:DNA helicase-2/ATP-dependent DNA helicase PcrA